MDEVYGLKYNQIEDLVEKVKANKGNLSGEGLPLGVTPNKEGQFYLDILVNELWYAKEQDGSLIWVNFANGHSLDEIFGGNCVATGQYYNNFEVTFSENGADNCEILEINTAKLQEFLAKHKSDEEWGPSDINFDYQEGYDPQTGEPTGEYMWMYRSMTEEVVIHPDDMYETTGIRVELIDPEAGWAYFSLYEKITIDTSASRGYIIPTEAYLETFSFTSENSMGKGYDIQERKLVDIPAVTIVSVNTQRVSRTPDYYLAFCTNISEDAYVNFQQVEEIGNSNLYQTNGNFAVQINGTKKIGNQFLMGNSAYAPQQKSMTYLQALTLNGVEEIGDGFLQGCSNFNATIYAPELEKIGNFFLSGCSSFNTALDLMGVKSIGLQFLYWCTSFNQPLKFEDSTRLCIDGLLQNCTAFNQDIRLPQGSYISYASTPLMGSMMAMTGVVDLGDLPATLARNSMNFTATSSSVPAYSTGITLKGTYVADWMSALPNGTNPYRKLINGGPSPSSGGTTYTFANTSTGWTASGSDGSSFTHTDLGDTITVDSALDTTSENPVQNKVIAGKVNSIESDITDIQGDIGDIESILQTINSGDLTEES